MVYLTTIEPDGPWDPAAEAELAAARADAEAQGKGEDFKRALEAAKGGGSDSSGDGSGGGDAGSWGSGARRSRNYSEYTAAIDEQSRAKGNQRIKIAGGFLFQVLSPCQTKMSAFLKLDLGLPIPDWVVDFIMKQVAAMFIPMLNAQAAKFEAGGKLAHLPEGPQYAGIYAEMHRRLNAMGGGASGAGEDCEGEPIVGVRVE